MCYTICVDAFCVCSASDRVSYMFMFNSYIKYLASRYDLRVRSKSVVRAIAFVLCVCSILMWYTANRVIIFVFVRAAYRVLMFVFATSTYAYIILAFMRACDPAS